MHLNCMNALGECCLTQDNTTVISLFPLALFSISARNLPREPLNLLGKGFSQRRWKVYLMGSWLCLKFFAIHHSGGGTREFERHFRKFQKGIEERKLFLEYQHTVALNPRAHQVGRGLFGWPYIKLFLTISPHFLLFWEKSSRITCSLRTPRPICRSSQIYRKISQKYAKHPLTLICVLNIGFLYCLKRARANKIFPLNQF